MGEFVRVEIGEVAGVATLRLDRPKANALNAQVMAELSRAVNDLSHMTDVRAVVIWGGPRVFAAGADIGDFSGMGTEEGRDLAQRFNAAFRAVELLPQITISAINGYALGGGCELAMATEFRLVGEGAVLGQPEINLGIIPGGGGTQRLSRLVGIAKAKELIYSGRNVYADEAVAIGLATAVYPDDEVYDEALKLAARYCSAPAAIAMAKRAILEGFSLPLSEALDVEVEAFAECFGTEDARIGVTSFLESGPGKAKFTGK
ncbi:MAG: enoyl-CoA hydratase/isomerase family protein [Acidimicrobiia bacterium]|nr:enoyl-CoA hydratase/isomerase family protein [Acidimicrobiia bacterium]MYC57923.1 enoyl-CoA hydratase/isomerase family protein [Acidimicrobiia bacterium]MYG93373.1 enoyl-CoA hydratase/isomerase family protein [Acidimicrobiia bacterium]MYI29846.1 enoyl-CoA hydratase/isomerase family protein [Acidimicrobiia bacterium]